MSSRAHQFWKSYWIALRRTGKDKRARTLAAAVTILLACLLSEVLLVIFISARGGPWAAGLLVIMCGTGIAAGILVRRWHRKQDEILEFSLTGRSRLRPRDVADASPDVRAYLEERAVIIASLLARGGSEIYLQGKQHDPGLDVTTRQNQNRLLRERGLWARLEQHESDLASAADGRWSAEQQNLVVAWCEQLRLLRWVLRLDAELIPLAHLATLDFSLSGDVLQPGNALRSGKSVIKPWDVRVQQDIALEYAARVIAELKSRSLIGGEPELEGWADDFRARVLGQSTDYLAGTRTISELDNGALRLLGWFATARERYSSYLIDQLNASEPSAFSAWESLARSA